ncbi:MAG: hypothetical protein JWO53_814 [Chlamydiia bacterium]|nr:hypothetical protein [Chlamydiia bacterium]
MCVDRLPPVSHTTPAFSGSTAHTVELSQLILLTARVIASAATVFSLIALIATESSGALLATIICAAITVILLSDNSPSSSPRYSPHNPRPSFRQQATVIHHVVADSHLPYAPAPPSIFYSAPTPTMREIPSREILRPPIFRSATSSFTARDNFYQNEGSSWASEPVTRTHAQVGIRSQQERPANHSSSSSSFDTQRTRPAVGRRDQPTHNTIQPIDSAPSSSSTSPFLAPLPRRPTHIPPRRNLVSQERPSSTPAQSFPVPSAPTLSPGSIQAPPQARPQVGVRTATVAEEVRGSEIKGKRSAVGSRK